MIATITERNQAYRKQASRVVVEGADKPGSLPARIKVIEALNAAGIPTDGIAWQGSNMVGGIGPSFVLKNSWGWVFTVQMSD